MSITRPFRNAHLALFLTLLIGAVYLLRAASCDAKIAAICPAFATAMIGMAGWLAHLRIGPLRDWRTTLQLTWETVGDVLKLATVVILVWFLSVLAMPLECYTPRVYVSELMTLAETPRAEIAKRYASHHSLADIGAGLHLNPQRADDWTRVLNDGSIVLFSGKAGAVVVLTPNPGPDGMHWTCSGTPQKNLPALCRD